MKRVVFERGAFQGVFSAEKVEFSFRHKFRYVEMTWSRKITESTVIAAISLYFAIWSSAFVFRSSFIAIDGERYFCLFDDAMISMRYAWNFAHGYGLVWNPGEYVQGYTNLLMTLLMSVAAFFLDKTGAVFLIQCLGIIFVLFSAYLAMNIVDYITPEVDRNHRMVRIIALSLVISYYPLSYWSLMGMETGLLTFLLLAGVILALLSARNDNPHLLPIMSLFFGLAFLTRNESIIAFLLVCAYVLIASSRPKIYLNVFFLVSIALYFSVILAQMVFQYVYYGDIFPNTYTLKLTGMPLFERIENGIGFIRPYLLETSVILLFAVVDIIFNFRKEKLLLISIVFSLIGYQVYVGGDPWNYWRIMAPAMPLMLVLFAASASTFSRFLCEYTGKHPVFPKTLNAQAVFLLLVLLGFLPVFAHFGGEMTLIAKPYTSRSNSANVNVAIALNSVTTEDASVGVSWAGSIPYFTGKYAIDFLGKSDRHIAGLPPDTSGSVAWYGMTSVPGHNKYDLNYSIRQLNPTYVQRFKWGRQDLSVLAQKEYILASFSGVPLYLRKDAPEVKWANVEIP